MASQAVCRLPIGEAAAAGQQQSQPTGGRLLRPPPRKVVVACSCAPCLASSHSLGASGAHFPASSSLSSRAGSAWQRQQQQQQEEEDNRSLVACQSRCHRGAGQQPMGLGTHTGCSSGSRAQEMSSTQGSVRPRQAQSEVLRGPRAAWGMRAGHGVSPQGLGNGAWGSIRPHLPIARQRLVGPCQSQGRSSPCSGSSSSSSRSSGSSRSSFICHAHGSENVGPLCCPNQGLSLAVWKGWRQADRGLRSSSSRSTGSSSGGSGRRSRLIARASLGELASGADVVIGNLGLDTLTFLVATVIVVPAFKSFKASPILGFLLSGVALNELGLIRNITDVKALSELGILFLLFEMGLELSLERLRALAKFAFGIGLPQVVLTTLAFTAFELPANNAIGTQMLEFLFGSKPDLVNIRSVDEAIVIGAALSLSSSAFVLQLLSEKGELATRFGSATLGILLLQDIAVVPLLVILPILESGDFTDDTLFPLLAAAGLKSLLGLGVLLLVGRLFLRRFFEFVADSRSTEAFVALCLLTVTGTALITSKLGFSDSLGAFLAGALLAETNYRTQVEADIRPFRGLLLGLFFVTTGTSIDINLLIEEWPNILALLGGLIAIKTAIIALLGPRAGLTPAESVRTGLLLSQGGEFAFVVFALANQLGVLPLELNRLLIIVVVLSMALTPLLDSLGRKAAEVLDSTGDNAAADATTEQNGAVAASTGEGSGHGHGGAHFEAAEPIVILGFNQQGQVLGNFLASPLASVEGGGWPYVSFDLNPKRVRAAKRLGFPVLYGDGSRTAVLQSAGISQPKAVIVVYSSRRRSVESVERLHHSFPSVPIFARAMDLAHMLELRRAGATDVVLESAETSFRLGSMLLQDLGVMRDDVVFLRGVLREAMMQRAMETLNKGPADADGAIDPTAMIASTMRDSRLALPTATAVGASPADADFSAPTTDTAITSTITSNAAATKISTASLELYDSDVDVGRAVDRNGGARGVSAELASQRSAGGGVVKSDSIGDLGLPDYLSDDESIAGESGGANAWRTVGSPAEGDVEAPPDDDSGKPLASRAAGVDSAGGGPSEPAGPVRVGGGVSAAADTEKPAALVSGKLDAAATVEAAGGFGPRAAVASLASAAAAAAAAGAAGVAAAVSGVVSGAPVVSSSPPRGGAGGSVGTTTAGGRAASSPPSATTVEPQADAAGTVGVAAAEAWRQVGDPAGAEGSDGWDGSLGGMVLADASASSEGEEWMGGGDGGRYLYFSDGEDAVDSTLQCTGPQRLPDLTQE